MKILCYIFSRSPSSTRVGITGDCQVVRRKGDD